MGAITSHLSVDVLYVMVSLRREFRYVTLYVVGSQGILIATNSKRYRLHNAKAIAIVGTSTPIARDPRYLQEAFEIWSWKISCYHPVMWIICWIFILSIQSESHLPMTTSFWNTAHRKGMRPTRSYRLRQIMFILNQFKHQRHSRRNPLSPNEKSDSHEGITSIIKNYCGFWNFQRSFYAHQNRFFKCLYIWEIKFSRSEIIASIIEDFDKRLSEAAWVTHAVKSTQVISKLDASTGRVCNRIL